MYRTYTYVLTKNLSTINKWPKSGHPFVHVFVKLTSSPTSPYCSPPLHVINDHSLNYTMPCFNYKITNLQITKLHYALFHSHFLFFSRFSSHFLYKHVGIRNARKKGEISKTQAQRERFFLYYNMRWVRTRACCVFLGFLLTNLNKTQSQRIV